MTLDDGEIMHVSIILNPKMCHNQEEQVYLYQLHHPYTFMATLEGIFLLTSCHALYINALLSATATNV